MTNSKELFALAQEIIPGGVNSPVRACKSVKTDPLFIAKADGAYVYTEDGQKYIDYVMSWGPMLLGHNHPAVNKALHEAVDKGTSYGAPCKAEIDLARAIVDALPGVEMVRMVNSGTEATMSALRLARGYTGRNKVVKFHGCYHGHADAFLASAGSGVATLSIPGTPGVPEETVKHTLLAEYNNLDEVKELFARYGEDIAAVFVEPVAGNMGVVLPEEGFLQGLRQITSEYGALLVFDEVITGFRVSFNGAQGLYGVIPDLTCLGKIIGGGLPVGAYGGKKEIMSRIAPCGDVYQAGTLSGNPLAMAAGLATINTLKSMDYELLAQKTKELALGLKDILSEKGVPVQVNLTASMFTLFFTSEPVKDFTSAQKSDQELFIKFYNQMREQGIYLAPSGFECAFNSFAHTEEDLEKTLDAANRIKF
ncbi:glutamate-1-semialdehyde 2,1-aminomutase [Desulfohalobiaceae bacterium Ax17]|uniref:glutamate-1-semialdehyde 2,1-aminomutase n=1 Tax=Desulfovulcanus ferrireducens TaxID=2831190 RepID=UPI00207BB176|nr:glutamate-1-semialdehyde 2,1-aminomutase [Desulfovulcanus ferrireducens]MBT8762608.1 glutamate-1-semialdehyde 2,1-aminomutase [Desulfovulcanus ferrireducens]